MNAPVRHNAASNIPAQNYIVVDGLFKSGIYLITNIVNGKKYIGLSNNGQRRMLEHLSPKSACKTTNLSKAFRKYGKESFDFSVLEYVYCESDLAAREVFWIEKLKPEYNMNTGGLGNSGRSVSSELKIKLRECGKKYWESLPVDKKLKVISSNLTGPKKGHAVSIETREKLRAANLNKKQSALTVKKRAAKLSVSMIGNSSGNKAVIAINNGSKVAEFDSVLLAAKSMNIHPSNISKVLKGNQKTAGGYGWQYLSKEKS